MTHKLIEEQYAVDGWSKDDPPDPATFADFQRLKMLLSSPAERASALAHIDSLIGQDDGTSLRSKADLFELRRKLSATDLQMRKANR